MSTFKKTTLALAVAAAFVPFTASAITVTYDDNIAVAGNQAPVYAQNIFASNSNTIASVLPFSINTTNSDVILGRTTGFNVRITLNTGRFDTTDDGTGATVGAGLKPSDTPAPWSISRAGGGINANTVTYAVTPPATGIGFSVIEGALFTLPPGAFVFENLAGLTIGSVLTGEIALQDPVGGATLATISVTFLVTEEGVVVECDPAGGSVAKRIDVAQVASFLGKRRFSPTGSIGGSSDNTGTPPNNLFFNAGQVDLGVTGRTAGFGFPGNSDVANSAGLFQMDPANDLYTVEISGTNFAPFNNATGGDRIFLSTSATCATGAGVSVAGVVNTAQDAATVEFNLVDLTLPATGGTAFVCFQQSSSLTPVAIDAQALSASVSVDIDNNTLRDPASAFSCPLLPLRFNGTVVDVATFNPAGNTTQESFLRVSNPSNISGAVTIEGYDDAGAEATPITFNLDAGKSLQLNSSDLESGNTGKGLTGAFGNGDGKWRLTVTGEFKGMLVSSLNRNNTTGTLANMSAISNLNDLKKDDVE